MTQQLKTIIKNGLTAFDRRGYYTLNVFIPENNRN